MLPDDLLQLRRRHPVLVAEVGHRLLHRAGLLAAPQAEGPDVREYPHRVEDVVEDVALEAGLVIFAVEPRPVVPAVSVPVGLPGDGDVLPPRLDDRYVDQSGLLNPDGRDGRKFKGRAYYEDGW